MKIEMTKEDVQALIDNPQMLDETFEEGREATKEALKNVAQMHKALSQLTKKAKENLPTARETTDSIFLDRMALSFVLFSKKHPEISAEKILDTIAEMADKSKTLVACNEYNVIMLQAIRQWVNDYEMATMNLICRLSGGIEPSKEVLEDEEALAQFLFECYLARIEKAKS